jgi:hypothetical protein
LRINKAFLVVFLPIEWRRPSGIVSKHKRESSSFIDQGVDLGDNNTSGERRNTDTKSRVLGQE